MAQAFFASRIAPDSHRAKTPEGYLIVKSVPIARTGWQKYHASEVNLAGDSLVDVYRSPEAVFNPATMASFEGKTITSPHPPTFLTPENDTGYYRGHAQNITRGGKLADGNEVLLGDLVIKDAGLISKIESKALEELSCGYEYELTPLADGEGKFAMTKIVGNHIAVVPRGRAGSSVRILDSMPEGQEDADVKEDGKVFTLRDILSALGFSPKATQAIDADPGAVERNEEKNKKALELKERTLDEKPSEDKTKQEEPLKGTDEKDKELKKEDEKASPPDKKDEKGAKDAESKLEERFAASDAKLDKLTDAVSQLVRAIDKKGKDEKEEKEEEKEEMEDGDLIPVETLSGKELPENPIPGADAKLALDQLLRLKTHVAKTGDAAAIEAFNNAVRTLKGKDTSRNIDGYREVANRSDKAKPDAVRNAETFRAADKDVDQSKSFSDTARQYLGKNPGEVKLESKGVN